MKKKLTALIAFLITALVLVGCSVEVSGPPAAPVEHRLDVPYAEPASPNATVNAGAAKRFKAYPAENFDEELMVFELRNVVPGVELNIRNDRGVQIAYSDSVIFGKDRAAVQALGGSELTPAAVVGFADCWGICIILPKSVYSNNTLIIDVDNPSGDTVEVYAYGAIYWDLNEPNDSIAQAEVVSSTVKDGAFETLSDVDYWRPINSDDDEGTFYITMSSSQLVLDAIVYDSSGQPVPGVNLAPVGTSGLKYEIDVFLGEVLALFVKDGLAAAPDVSKYEIQYLPYL